MLDCDSPKACIGSRRQNPRGIIRSRSTNISHRYFLKTARVQQRKEWACSECLNASDETHAFKHKSEQSFIRVLEAHVRRSKKSLILYVMVWWCVKRIS